MIATLSFFIENVCNRYNRSIGAMIHQALSPGGVDWLPPLILLRNMQWPVHWRSSSPPNQCVPEIVSPLSCLPALVRKALLIVYFFLKNLFLSWAPLTNATPAFSTL